MKLYPQKTETTSNLIPQESKAIKSGNLDLSSKDMLHLLLSELGMGYFLYLSLLSSPKHIDIVCSRQLSCTRYRVPAGTNLYTFKDAADYPVLHYLVSGDVSIQSQSGVKLREFRGPSDYNINHILQPAVILLGCRIRNSVSLCTTTECVVVQFVFKVAPRRQADPLEGVDRQHPRGVHRLSAMSVAGVVPHDPQRVPRLLLAASEGGQRGGDDSGEAL